MTSQTPDILLALIAASAACLAAWVTGSISILGLLISKEQEVSKFRQAWIDDLRRDAAELIANAYLIHSHRWKPVPFDQEPFDYNKFLMATKESYLQLNKASTRIKLRLNPSECDSKLILQSMAAMEQLFVEVASGMQADPLANLNKIVNALERDMPLLLKKEWRRVKSGEPIYRKAKLIATILFVLTGLFTAIGIVALWRFAH